LGATDLRGWFPVYATCSAGAAALAIAEKALGPDHPYVATSLDSLAGPHQDEGPFTAAEPLLERALQIREKALGLTISMSVRA
jgi:hypothetical protein